MHLPALAPQRSVLKAAFLYDYEMLLGSGDFLYVYHRCSLSRVVPISKRKEVRVSWIPEKVVCFMYVGEASCCVISLKSLHLVQPRKPQVCLFSIYHEIHFTGFAFYWSFAQLLNQEFCGLHHAFFTCSQSQTLQTDIIVVIRIGSSVLLPALWNISYPFLSRYMDKEKRLQIDFQ